MKTILSALGLSLLVFTSCGGQKKAEVDFIQDNIDNAVAQNTIQTDIIEKSGKILNPRTINKDGSISYIPIDDWCSGFFPGSMWLTYNLTGDKKWLPLAEKYTEALDSVKHLKWHHDVGFMIGCSYLNGYRLADKKEYKDVVVEAASAHPVTDTLKRADKERFTIPEQVERDGLWCMETPQVFQYPLLLDAYVEVTERNIQVTDEVTALQLIGHPTRLVHNHEPNPKITWPEDISRAEMLMELKHLRNDS